MERCRVEAATGDIAAAPRRFAAGASNDSDVVCLLPSGQVS
jgi:hypothetical protein